MHQIKVVLLELSILYMVVVAHIYPPATRLRQSLNVGRSAHFSLWWLLRAWRNPHLLRSSQSANVTLDFFKFLSTEFAACSKSPSKDNYRKASYPRMQLQGPGWGLNPDNAIRNVVKRDLYPLGHAVSMAAIGVARGGDPWVLRPQLKCHQL